MNGAGPYTKARGLGVAALAVMATLLVTCGTPRRPAPPSAPGPAAPIVSQEGLATYYSSRLEGRRTASGEPYDPDEMTAAHRTLRFGTVVRVTRTEGGQSVVVRINDRGPYVRARIIDVSMAAARRLNMLGPGVVKVRLEILTPGKATR